MELVSYTPPSTDEVVGSESAGMDIENTASTTFLPRIRTNSCMHGHREYSQCVDEPGSEDDIPQPCGCVLVNVCSSCKRKGGLCMMGDDIHCEKCGKTWEHPSDDSSSHESGSENRAQKLQQAQGTQSVGNAQSDLSTQLGNHTLCSHGLLVCDQYHPEAPAVKQQRGSDGATASDLGATTPQVRNDGNANADGDGEPPITVSGQSGTGATDGLGHGW